MFDHALLIEDHGVRLIVWKCCDGKWQPVYDGRFCDQREAEDKLLAITKDCGDTPRGDA